MEEQKKLALEERDAWNALTREERAKYKAGCRDYWAERGRKPGPVEQRQYILNTSGAEFLWEEMNKGLPLSTAASLVKQYRKQKRPLLELWEEYQKGTVVRMGNGRTFKKRAKTRTGGKRTFDRALQLIERAIEEEPLLIALDPYLRMQYVHETMSVVRGAVADLRARLQRDNTKLVSRQQVIEDCRTFNLDPPKTGIPLSQRELKTARDRRNSQISKGRLHPDVNGGDPDKTAHYMQLMASYQRLEQYSDQLTSPQGKDNEQSKEE